MKKKKDIKIEQEKKLSIALVGNPNCGKTTLFNLLTGSNQHIGNWAGVTVSLKEGAYKADKSINIVDLPGIYGMSPLSQDEVVARDYILNEKPEIILNVIDATNLERSLYLTTQLMALDAKLLVAINMCDEAKKRGLEININELEKSLGVKIVEISAKKKQGINELMQVAKGELSPSKHLVFANDIEEVLKTTAELNLMQENVRFHNIKLLEMDNKEIKDSNISEESFNIIKERVQQLEESYNDNITSIIATARYNQIHSMVNSSVSRVKVASISDKIDKIVLNKWLAFPIFALVMFLTFFLSIQTIGAWTVKGMEALVDLIANSVRSGLESVQAWDWVISLLVDGVIAGVGGVIVYLPQIMILFGLISILEACGYMSRVVYIMDKLMSKIGLSGKSFIPLILGFGCSVPAIMGTRTIKNVRDRNATIMITPFIPCSAKLPMFSFFTTKIFGGNALVATTMYFVSILAVILGGLILKWITRKQRAEKDAFVMELPPYRTPSAGNVLRDMWDRGKSFLIKAGTIIFVATIVLWLLKTFNFKFQMVGVEDSMLASIGKVITPLFIPLGIGDWRLVVATLTGTIAKETIVATLEILQVTGANFTSASAYSFMTFNLLFFPCISAVATYFKELESAKLGFLAMLFQTTMAYVFACVFYWSGVLATNYTAIFWSVLSLVIVGIAVLIAVLYLVKRKKKLNCSLECATCSMRSGCKKHNHPIEEDFVEADNALEQADCLADKIDSNLINDNNE